MIATIGTGGAAGYRSAGIFPANALPTALAVSPEALSGRAKSEKRPRLENPELMTTPTLQGKCPSGEFGIGLRVA